MIDDAIGLQRLDRYFAGRDLAPPRVALRCNSVAALFAAAAGSRSLTSSTRPTRWRPRPPAAASSPCRWSCRLVLPTGLACTVPPPITSPPSATSGRPCHADVTVGTP
ncbi:MAG: hypothetical protein R3D25_04500 [Geminicoccaceae bacterium]